MADFEINKGVGREVEFKGLRAQYLFVRHPVYGRCQAVNLYRFRGGGGYRTGMADLHAEPQIRQPRANETVRGPAASPENPLTKTYHTSD